MVLERGSALTNVNMRVSRCRGKRPAVALEWGGRSCSRRLSRVDVNPSE